MEANSLISFTTTASLTHTELSASSNIDITIPIPATLTTKYNSYTMNTNGVFPSFLVTEYVENIYDINNLLYSNANLDVLDASTSRPVAYIGDSNEGALTKVVNTETEFTKFQYGGIELPWYSGDYYNRVHILPSNISFGSVISDTVYDIELWNAYIVPMEVTSISSVGTTGMSLLGLSAPSTLGALSSINLQLLATVNGPANIDGNYTVNFESGDKAVLLFDGNRIVIWRWEPNKDYKETLEWKTDVMKTRKGEQRAALRDSPRTVYAYNFSLTPEQITELETIVSAWGTLDWALPIWREYSIVDVNQDDTTIQVTTSNTEYAEGGYIMLWKSSSEYKAYTITGITDTEITIFPSLQESWSNALIMPAVSATIVEGYKQSRGKYYNWSEISAEFDVITSKLFSGTLSYPTLNGYEVLTDSTIITSGWSENVRVMATVVDNGQGKRVYDTTQDFRRKTRTLQKLFTDKDDIWNFRAWLHTKKGKQKAFYLPRWSQDFEVTQESAATTTSITVSNKSFAKYFSVDVPVLIGYKDGSTLLTNINASSTLSDSEEIIYIDDQLTKTTNSSTVAIITILDLVRFDTDRFDLNHGRDNRMKFSANLVEVPA